MVLARQGELIDPNGTISMAPFKLVLQEGVDRQASIRPDASRQRHVKAKLLEHVRVSPALQMFALPRRQGGGISPRAVFRGERRAELIGNLAQMRRSGGPRSGVPGLQPRGLAPRLFFAIVPGCRITVSHGNALICRAGRARTTSGPIASARRSTPASISRRTLQASGMVLDDHRQEHGDRNGVRADRGRCDRGCRSDLF